MHKNFNELSDIKSIPDFELSKNTTYGLGGKCRIAYFPKTEDEAERVFKISKSKNDKIVVLGNGSNILASDTYFDGCIISTLNLNKIVQIDSNKIMCQSGVKVAELLHFCEARHLGGLEFLFGIPATVGGLTYMNGGAGGQYLGEKISSVKIFSDKIDYLTNAQCAFGDKHSTMRDIDCVILSTIIEVETSSSHRIKENIEFYRKRRINQPKGKSCGCIFKNPPGLSAGKLIDDCGLKGKRIGGAYVSCNHANFIINDGGTADNVYALINYVKNCVFDCSGIKLNEEVVYIGEFNDTFC